MRTKLTLQLLLLGTVISLSNCVSYTVAVDKKSPTTCDRLKAGAIDLVTLPAQAVVIPALYAVEACQRAQKSWLPDKRTTLQATPQSGK